MSLKSILRGLAPIAGLALVAAATSGCNKAHVSINGEEGVALSELDLSGPAPTEVALLGPDTVRIATGDRLAITVDGAPDVTGDMRFTLKDGKLGILRKDGTSSGEGIATVNVTMPVPHKLMMAGSGKIFAPGLASDEARVMVAGSGTVETANLATESLKVDIAGSGTYRAAGEAKALRLMIAGSGDAQLDGLTVDEANVDVAGSGRSVFASDGTVRAKIMGSGEVRVIGRATCKVSSMGSGRLVCEPAANAEAKPESGKPKA